MVVIVDRLTSLVFTANIPCVRVWYCSLCV
jgi:hypothetical protein